MDAESSKKFTDRLETELASGGNFLSVVAEIVEGSIKKMMSDKSPEEQDALYQAELEGRPALKALMAGLKAGKMPEQAVDDFHQEQADRVQAIKNKAAVMIRPEAIAQVNTAFDEAGEKDPARTEEERRNVEEGMPLMRTVISTMFSPEVANIMTQVVIAVENQIGSAVDQGIVTARFAQKMQGSSKAAG